MKPQAQPAQDPMPMVRPHDPVWPRRVPRTITPPATSLWHNLAISALRYPDKAASVFFGTRLAYRDLMYQAERLAACLHRCGVRPGDRVVLAMQNCPQLLVAHWGILRANAVVVPVNPMNRAEELKHFISDPDARVAITTADLAAEWARASSALAPGQRLAHLIVTHFTDAFDPAVQGPDAPPAAWHAWLTTRHDHPSLAGGQVQDWPQALAGQDDPPPHTAGPQDLALLPYTSGTTGLPKGCMHPHATLMHQAVAAGLLTGGSAENVSLAVVPMFHVTGMISVMHSAIYLGATLVILPRWDRDCAGRMIARWRVTHWTNIPTMVIDLLASPNLEQVDLSSLVLIGGGGPRCRRRWRSACWSSTDCVMPRATA
jgi:fatty-acyl-CoA synthase